MLGRLGVLGAAALFVVSACGGGGTGGSAAGCTVGVSWNNYQEERWAKWDEPAMKKAIEAGGGKYISNDAKSSAETQASNVDNLISQGAKVVVILAQDGTAIKPAVAKSIQNGVPVIAYDRLIEDPKALYITFDNVLVGKLEAQAVFKAKATGNYAIIKGNKADANADFLRSGMEQVIGDAVKSKAITIVGEVYTDNWDPAKAQTNMEQILTANQNKVDAVLSENDGMAGGVIAVDGPEHDLLFQPGAPEPADFVRGLVTGLRATGLAAVVNLNCARPPACWSPPAHCRSAQTRTGRRRSARSRRARSTAHNRSRRSPRDH